MSPSKRPSAADYLAGLAESPLRVEEKRPPKAAKGEPEAPKRSAKGSPGTLS